MLGIRTKQADLSAVRTVVRLSPDQLAEVRKRVGGPASCIVGAQTTDIQAGYMLGINHVLNILAEGFTLTPP